MNNIKLHALVIDDDEDDLFLFVRSLQETRCFDGIKSFTDGSEAMAYLRSVSNVPDVVITDLKMPLMTGFDIIKAIKSNHDLEQIPVIAFSTSSYIVDIEQTKQLGAKGFITKPYNMDDYKNISMNIISHISGTADSANNNPAIKWFG